MIEEEKKERSIPQGGDFPFDGVYLGSHKGAILRPTEGNGRPQYISITTPPEFEV